MFAYRDNANAFKEMREVILGESESESGGDEMSESVDEDDEDVWSRSTCECDLCTKMNQTLDHWDSWKPQSEIEKMLQKVINGMDV